MTILYVGLRANVFRLRKDYNLRILVIAKCLERIQFTFILTLIRAIVPEEGSRAPGVSYIGFIEFISPERRDSPRFYCGTSMLLTLG